MPHRTLLYILKEEFAQIRSDIISNPKTAGVFGGITSALFGFIDLSAATNYIEFFGVVVKTLGICFGSAVAGWSFFTTIAIPTYKKYKSLRPKK